MSKLAVIVGTSEATSDPLDILIEREERIIRDEKDEARDVVTPNLMLIPSFLISSLKDPLENLIALSDPEEVLRQALIN